VPKYIIKENMAKKPLVIFQKNKKEEPRSCLGLRVGSLRAPTLATLFA